MRVCKIENCLKIPSKKRKVCSMHIQRKKVHGSYDPPLKKTRIVKVCKVHGQLEIDQINFYRSHQRCKLCAKEFLRIEIPEEVQERECVSCKKFKNRNEFQPSSWNSRLIQCRDCKREVVRNRRVLAHKNGTVHLTSAVRSNLLKSFGITTEKYLEILISQKGVCAICKKGEVSKIAGLVKRLCLDHSHATGKVRGLLCQSCNVGLGLFKDSPENLRAAIKYLEYDKDI